MLQQDDRHERLSDFERAVCYYSLPRAVSPLTFGGICVYAAFIAQALAAMAYGVYAWDTRWLVNGTIVLLWLIAIGSVVFLVRAFRNEVRERRLLAAAKIRRETVEVDSDLPDPFENHVLLRHPIGARGRLFPCTENNDALHFFVDSPPESPFSLWARRHEVWNVRTKHDTEYCRISVIHGLPSFVLDPVLPGNLIVHRDGKEVARIISKFSFHAPATIIRLENPVREYFIRRQGIYFEDRLVGRMYAVRHSFYLDVEEQHFNEGILAYFVVWS